MSRGGWTTHIVLVTVLFKPSASPIIVVTLVKQKKRGGGGMFSLHFWNLSALTSLLRRFFGW